MISNVFNNIPPPKVFSYTIPLNYSVGYDVLSHNHVEMMLVYRTMIVLSLLKFCVLFMLFVFANTHSGV